MRKGRRNQKNVYRRERTRAAYVLLLYFSLYLLFVVLTGSWRPFEGALVPREKGVSTPNSGTWYPKPRRVGGQGHAVVLTGSSRPFCQGRCRVFRARPGTPPLLSGLLQARAGVPGRALLLTELICIEVEDA